LRAVTEYDDTNIGVSWAAPTTQTAVAALTDFTVQQYTHVVNALSGERTITLSDTRTTAASIPSVVFDSVVSGGVYSYLVVANNAYGSGAPSPHSNLVVPGGSLPGKCYFFYCVTDTSFYTLLYRVTILPSTCYYTA
jgi:hypothetical protein